MSKDPSDSSTSRFWTAFRLALIVLISPLCPMVRNTCARYQFENVFVEYRRWNTTTSARISGSRRSG